MGKQGKWTPHIIAVTVFAVLVLASCETTAETTAVAFNSDFVMNGTVLVKYKGNPVNVTIPQGVTSIESSAFEGCSSLASVTIPSSVTSYLYSCRGVIE